GAGTGADLGVGAGGEVARSRVLLFGGVEGVASQHDLWEWRGGGGDRAAHVVRVPFAASNVGRAVVNSVDARVIAVGPGDDGGGARLVSWTSAGWTEAAVNAATSPADAAATMNAAVGTTLLGAARTLSVAVAETGVSGRFADRDDVETDYLELSFSYSLP